MSSEFLVDQTNGVVMINDSGVESASVIGAMAQQQFAPELAAVSNWVVQQRSASRMGSLFERDRYVTPPNIYDQFRVAHDASENDDVVSNVLEMTESLAFSRVSFTCEDDDQENIWDQWAADINLDARIREMWRELFKVSQFTMVNWPGTKTYKVQGRSQKGVTRKKTFDNLIMPLGLTMLDPLKVIPVGSLMFNQEKLAYLADWSERDEFDRAAAGDPNADEIARAIILRRYEPSQTELTQLAKFGGAKDRMFLLDPTKVWRHTDTRSQYERFAAVRMKSVFELLDLKHQLRQMERSTLIGATNFLILVKKGTDQKPADQREIDHLQAQVRTVARMPIIVGDHRLSIEIITPKTDTTLNPEKHGMIDQRIAARLFGMFVTGGAQAGGKGDDSVKLAKVVARGLTSRRRMLIRAIEQYVIRPTMNANPQLTEMPKLKIHPTRIDLEFDASTAQFLMDLRDRGDISRDTLLNEMDFDQEDEAMMREREAKYFDKHFKPVVVPFSGQGGTDPNGDGNKPDGDGGPEQVVTPKQAGRRGGGTKNGGGSNPNAGKPPVRGRPKERERPRGRD